MPVFGEKRTCLVARISGANHSKWSTLLWGEWRRPKRYLAGLTWAFVPVPKIPTATPALET
jgi:hypothetical protein